MGASVTDPYGALDAARRRFAESTDFTVAIEEEFQILDATSLGLVNRYAELRDRADRSVLAEHVAGELIASEIEVKTGRCESFPEAVRRLHEHRRTIVELADDLGLALCPTGTHPFSPWWEQEIIDTPHYRVVEGQLRYVAWRNNTFGIHLHVGVRDADRAMAVCGALRSVLPELLAVSASSPWLEGRHTHLRSTRTQIFTRMFPRCGVPDVFASWAEYDGFVRFLLETGSIREHTEIWWSVRPHQAFGTVEIRICDGQPDASHAIALSALQLALVAHFAALYDAGEPLPSHPARDVEENLWRAIRWGMSRELIDLDARRAEPAAERVAALVQRCRPQIDALGLAPYLEPLDGLLADGDLASRLSARLDEGEDLQTLFAEQVRLTRSSIDQPTGAAS
jgi:carboxylate-amine ligase